MCPIREYSALMDRRIKRDILRRLERLNWIVVIMANRLVICLTRKYRMATNHYLKRNLLHCTAGLLRIIPKMV